MSRRAEHAPMVRALTQHECLALLARSHVGRLAFAFHDRVDIRPLHYVYEAGWLYGRTSDSAKLTTLAHNPWVAFEVDEVRGAFDWRSVVVHGSFHRIDERLHAGAHGRAITLLRSVVPETLTDQDPAPSRTVVFRIAIGTMSGRVATPGDRHPTASAEAEGERLARGTPARTRDRDSGVTPTGARRHRRRP